MQDFSDKIVIVTGAASGIGEAIARDLAARGAKIVAADFNREGAEKLAGELGDQVRPFMVDVSKADQVKAMVDFTTSEFGGLDGAVNNAGIGAPDVKMGELDPDDWQKVIGVNLNGVFYGLRYQIPAMLERGGGAIVNMASILGAVGWSGASAYVAAKHGVLGLTQTAALEYAAQNMRVNAVGPGFIETPLIRENMSDEALAGLEAMHPVGRLGTPDEVAKLTAFLLSDQASFANGAYYPLDGGFLAR
ncbi:SDR family NAD(P)-dependent oxidoreductase [Altericroceibacterium endophyticum]|uniref:SDR family oxidoreductase n=1 Tax=Altericroceibacterium endophyticum TaxID=1808508 RepID=A0A6I4TA22_9SPHN|nr:SDR family NAD(P)-dependent oxidoreductase [Altericroceibacterium endophyticum]MXO66863.1 SDR family oxidoreductase [Altericroceibacterium endophyticum]